MRGVAIDNINQQVMTAGADCKLKVKWQLFMFNVCVYFGSKLNFFTRIRISSKMMQRKLFEFKPEPVPISLSNAWNWLLSTVV